VREERPADDQYYETRIPLLSQGDLFRDVPLAYPVPGAIVEDESDLGFGSRHFLAGPLETGFAVLTTPTCSMRPATALQAVCGRGGKDIERPVRS